MSLDIGSAVSRCVARLTTPAGGAVLAAFVVVNLLTEVLYNSLAVALSPATTTPAMQTLSLPLPDLVAVGLALATIPLSAGVSVVAARVLVRERSELSSLPPGVFRRRIGMATITAILANIVTVIAVAIGLVLLIIPGIFIALSLLFTTVLVAVEDAGVFGALRESWGLASGHRLRLFGLMLVVMLVALAVGLLTVPVSIAAPVAGRVVSQLASAIVASFSIGVIADAYGQLRAAEVQEEEEETVGALTAEDLADGW